MVGDTGKGNATEDTDSFGGWGEVLKWGRKGRIRMWIRGIATGGRGEDNIVGHD